MPDKRESFYIAAVKKISSYLSALFTPAFLEAFFLVIIYFSLANYISIKAIGIITCIFAINFCILSIFDIGVSEAAAILVSRYFSNHSKMYGVIYKTYFIVIVQIILACTFLFIAAPWISRYIIHKELTTFIRCSSLWLPPLFLARYYNGLFKGFGKIRFSIFPVLVSGMLKLEVLVIAFSFQKGLLFIINGWTICYAVSGGFYFYLVQRSLFGDERQKDPVEEVPYMELFHESLLVAWQSFSQSFVWFVILLLSVFISYDELGLFAVCYHVTAFSFMLLLPLTEAMYIPLFNACERRDIDAIKGIFRLIVKYTSFLGYLVLAVWMFWGEMVLGFIGASAVANSKVLDIIVLGMWFDMFGRAFDPLLYVFGEEKILKSLELARLIIFAAVYLFLLSNLSIFYAATLLSTIFLCSASFKLVKLEKLYNVNISKGLDSFIWLPIILLPLYFIGAPFLLFVVFLLYWLVTEKVVTFQEYKQIFMRL